ncbi:MAG: NAD+ synthase [Anaerolineae bacterium]
MNRLRIGLAQIDVTVGDLEGNVRRILAAFEQARRWGVDVVVLPELAITGYPPEDLLLKPDFVRANRAALEDLIPSTCGLTAIVGFVDRQDDIYNAAAIINDGRLAAVYHKIYLPNYGVFDENRYFQAGHDTPVFRLGDATFAVNICEDIWYSGGPTRWQSLHGNAELIINISASPYHIGKGSARERMLAARAVDNVCCVAMCNMVGGQDELVFDGHSLVVDEHGATLARGRQFEEDLVLVDLDLDAIFNQRLHDPRRREEKARSRDEARAVPVELSASQRVLEPRPDVSMPCAAPLEPVAEVYQALLTGTRDYVRKNGFHKVVIGLSGGIDSALTACIAADALGPENVTGVTMPSQYSAPMSAEDSATLAANLGISIQTIPIWPVFERYLEQLAEPFAGRAPDIAEENLQARIRGNLLMALSNKFGWLVLTTGNKSEMSVGYATLYGDMAGGFAVLKDVPKTLVYELARWRNRCGEVIPQRILTRPPTAELRPNQKDTDSLPPYEVLDPILQLYVEEDRSPQEIIARGYDPDTVRRVALMVDRAEYKRRQAPPGVKITARAFGRDRRLPITNRYRGPC